MDFLQNKNRLTASCHETEISAVPLMFAQKGALTGPSTFCLNATTRTDLPPHDSHAQFHSVGSEAIPCGDLLSCARTIRALSAAFRPAASSSQPFKRYCITSFTVCQDFGQIFSRIRPDFRQQARPLRGNSLFPLNFPAYIRPRESDTAHRRASRR